jgi:1,4-dihydroxy-2-naphthoate octaprenyltransferase
MTHYSNDYYDQDADAATFSPTRWSSGSRVLPDGLLPPQAALRAALVCGGVALGATAVLMTLVSSPFGTLCLWGLSIFLAWNYSSPPLWLNRRGLGEISATLLVSGLTTLLAFQVQTGQVTLLPILAVIPLCFFQFAMLLSVNFPDAAGDVLVNKRTLVVMWGSQRTATLFLVVLITPYLLLPLLVWLGLPTAIAFAVLLMLPLAAWQGWRIRQGAATDATQWEALGFWSIGLLLITTLLETAVFLIIPS